MEAYAIDHPGERLFEERFGRGFENFYLFNDAAIDACATLGFDSGTQLGKIGIDEVENFAIPLFKTEFWT